MFLIRPDIYYRHDHSTQAEYEAAEFEETMEESGDQSTSFKTIMIAGVALTTFALFLIVMSQLSNL